MAVDKGQYKAREDLNTGDIRSKMPLSKAGIPIQTLDGAQSRHFLASAAASMNATVVKATPGKLYRVTGRNAAAAIRYIKFFNKATAPDPSADAATLMKYVIEIPASVPFDVDFGPHGLDFSTGIGYVIVTGIAETDETAVTAADILILQALYT
jgi:hypothetical protein